ncbi:hypothetical protein VEx25_1503 [Vibrio antiquarius]|uniref:Transposase n=1 Tax=Vibrio antiquarius (strain Ex25) TaxID=150340 RepID=A0ABM9WWP3_VIBAE|nr:hypothetical protein VEx25_1503 [Vibrio antiquarius]
MKKQVRVVKLKKKRSFSKRFKMQLRKSQTKMVTIL